MLHTEEKIMQNRGINMTIGDGHDLKSQRFAGDEVLEACYDNKRVLPHDGLGQHH